MDIKIDFENNDLEFKNGDLVVTSGDECIKQQVKTGLFILPFDWFIDITKGINYFHGFRNDDKKLKAQIKDAIKSVEGVERLGKFAFDNSTTNWNVQAIIYTANSEIEVNSETPLGERNAN